MLYVSTGRAIDGEGWGYNTNGSLVFVTLDIDLIDASTETGQHPFLTKRATVAQGRVSQTKGLQCHQFIQSDVLHFSTKMPALHAVELQR